MRRPETAAIRAGRAAIPAPAAGHAVRAPHRPTRPRGIAVALAAALAFTGTSTPVEAATRTWNAGCDNNNWTCVYSILIGGSLPLGTTNWSGTNNLPANGDSLVFAGTSGLTNSNTFSSLSIANLSFGSSAGNFVLNGNALFLTGNITNSSTKAQTLNLGITFTGLADQQLTAGTGGLILGDLTFSGLGARTITGSGRIVLNGDLTNLVTAPSNVNAAQTLNAPVLIGANQAWLGGTTGLVFGGGISFATDSAARVVSNSGRITLKSNLTNASANLQTFSGALTIGSAQTWDRGVIGLSVGGITFGSGLTANALTHAGTGLLISTGDISNGASTLQTITAPLTVGADQVWTGGSAGLAFGGGVYFPTGSAARIVTATGSITLKGNLVNASANLQTIAGALTVGSTQTWDRGGAGLSVGGITFAGGLGANALTLAGTGALISTGDLVNSSGSAQALHAPLTVGANQAWNGGVPGLVFENAVALGGRTVSTSGSITLRGGISGGGTITGPITIATSQDWGSGALRLEGPVTFADPGAGLTITRNTSAFLGDTTNLGASLLTLPMRVSVSGSVWNVGAGGVAVGGFAFERTNTTLSVQGSGSLYLDGDIGDLVPYPTSTASLTGAARLESSAPIVVHTSQTWTHVLVKAASAQVGTVTPATLVVAGYQLPASYNYSSPPYGSLEAEQLVIGQGTVTVNPMGMLTIGKLVNGTRSGSLVNGAGTGRIVVSGGTLNLDGASFDVDQLDLADANKIILNDGQALRTGSTRVGAGGMQQAGGTHRTETLTVVVGAAYALDNGSLTANGGTTGGTGPIPFPTGTRGGAVVDGRFDQAGGTHSVNNLALASHGPGSGVYNLSGGTLDVGAMVCTSFLPCTPLFGGGTLTPMGGITRSLGSTTINFTGGALNLIGTSISVGEFNMTGTRFSLLSGKTFNADTLRLGAGATFALDGGTASVGSGPGSGILSHNGGRGSFSFTAGALNLANGAAIDTEAFSLAPVSGALEFTLAAGRIHSATNLMLGAAAGGTGRYVLDGGTLNAGRFANGSAMGGIEKGSGTADFEFRSGSLNLVGTSITTDNFRVGTAAGSNAAFTLDSGKTHTTTALELGGTGIGTYTLAGGLLRAGGIVAGPGGRLDWLTGTLHITGADGATLGGTGSVLASVLNLTAGQRLQVDRQLAVGSGLLVLSGGVVQAGSMRLAGGSITAQGGGTLDMSGIGALDGHGTVNARIVNGAGSTISAAGGNLVLGSMGAADGFTYAGTLDVGASHVVLLSAGKAQLGSGTTLAAGGQLSAVNGASLGVGRALAFTGNASILGNFTNNGTVSGSGGTLTFQNDVNGAGSFAGNIAFHAGYNPGNSPATVNHNGGNVTIDSTSLLTMEILGPAPGTQYDQLVGINTLTFNGRLALSFGNGFTPAPGSHFALFQFASFAGSLAADRIDVTGFDRAQLDFSHLGVDGSFAVAAVPELDKWAMFAAGLGLMGFMARRRRARPAQA